MSEEDVDTLKGTHGILINVNDDHEVNPVGTASIGKVNLYLEDPDFGNTYSVEELTNFGVSASDVGKWSKFKVSTDKPVDISSYDMMVFSGFYC